MSDVKCVVMDGPYEEGPGWAPAFYVFDADDDAEPVDDRKLFWTFRGQKGYSEARSFGHSRASRLRVEFVCDATQA